MGEGRIHVTKIGMWPICDDMVVSIKVDTQPPGGDSNIVGIDLSHIRKGRWKRRNWAAVVVPDGGIRQGKITEVPFFPFNNTSIRISATVVIENTMLWER
jgi:hypothetical protein